MASGLMNCGDLISKQTSLLAMGSNFMEGSLVDCYCAHRDGFECLMRLLAHALLNLPSNSLSIRHPNAIYLELLIIMQEMISCLVH